METATAAVLAAEALAQVGANPQRAQELAADAAIRARRERDSGARSTALRARGLAAKALGDLDAGLDRLRAAVRVAQRAGLPQHAAEARMSLAFALLERGDIRSALRHADAAATALRGLAAVAPAGASLGCLAGGAGSVPPAAPGSGAGGGALGGLGVAALAACARPPPLRSVRDCRVRLRGSRPAVAGWRGRAARRMPLARRRPCPFRLSNPPAHQLPPRGPSDLRHSAPWADLMAAGGQFLMFG